MALLVETELPTTTFWWSSSSNLDSEYHHWHIQSSGGAHDGNYAVGSRDLIGVAVSVFFFMVEEFSHGFQLQPLAISR